jgi:hypothetical protein
MVQGVYGFRSGKSVSVSHRGVTKTLLFETTAKAKEALERIKRVAATNNPLEIQSLFHYFDAGSITGDKHGVFERGANNQWYLKGYTIPMPIPLVMRINTYLEQGAPIDALVNFWMLCMANPDSRARTDLFSFADRYNFPITPFGYFVGYKSVYVKKSPSSALDVLCLDDIEDPHVLGHGNTLTGLDDASIEDLKKTADLWVVRVMDSGEKFYMITDPEGLTEEAFLDKHEEEIWDITEHLPDEGADWDNSVHEYFTATYMGSYKKALDKVKTISGIDTAESTFTDIHSQTFTIKLGEVVNMPRHQCDPDPERTCSSGLHIGAPGYVKGFGGGYERRIIACLVNPAHVVAVPVDYSYEKMRVCEYFPYAISDFDKADNLNEIDTQFYEADYIGYEMDQLKQEIAKYSGEYAMTEAADVKRNRLSVITIQ